MSMRTLRTNSGRSGLQRLAALGGALVAASLVLTGCAGADDTNPDAGADDRVVEEARALLPDEIIEAGELRLVSAFDYPPYAMLDDAGEFQGSDYELGTEIAHRLGLEPVWSLSSGFSTLIPAVENGRADVAMDSIAILPERFDKVSFVKYQLYRETVMVHAGNPLSIDVSDLCGVRMATESGTLNEQRLTAMSEECVDAGKPAIDQAFFPTTIAAAQAVQSGQRDAMVLDVVAAETYVKNSGGSLESLEADVWEPTPSGIVVRRDMPELGEAIALALVSMQEDGTYAEILEQHGLGSIQVDAVFLTEPEAGE